jgi:isoquinoline 1-oxidoreductase subunit beta
MNEIVNLSRRSFLKTGAVVSGGLVLGLSVPMRKNSGKAFADSGGPAVLNAFVRIAPDDTVTVIVNKSEMGEGVYTSMPMLLAEELECDWKKVRVEPAPVAPVYNHTAFGTQLTGGSTSVPSEWERMRKMGAAAREMLIAAAAETWGVDRASCRAENSMVVHSSGKKLTYGELAEKAAKMIVPDQIALKDPSKFKIIGRPTPRLDTPVKVTGKALFGIDAKVPGVLTALVARAPVFGGKVKSFSAAKAMAVPGVKEVVQVPTGVAVAADNFWSAKKGRDVLEVIWDEGPLAGLSTPGLRQEYANLAKTPGATAKNEGNAEEALKAAQKRVDAEYEVPYLAHATMEPLNCLVDLRPSSCDIWTGTQAQTWDRDAAANILGFKPEQVRVHTLFLGGGFGRRANPHSDFVSEAAEVAKAIKKPVRVIWTREDDMTGGYYRPMWYDRLSAGLDAKGSLTAWRHTIVGQSIMEGTTFEKAMTKGGVDEASVEGAADSPYEIPNFFVSLHSPKTGVPVQWWRSVGHSHTGFVVESFMDEMAFAAGKDPYEFRRNLLAKHPRHRGVLDLAARSAGWGTPGAPGRARGIAMHESFGSFVAQVAEVSVSPEGEVRVHKVVCAVDCGRTVNPSTIEAQMESGIVYGLTAALYGAMTFKNGRVQQTNFDTYPLLRIGEMPLVEVHILQTNEHPGGIGEPGTPPIAAAVANAIFAATGKRVRRLPIDQEALRKA